MKIVVFFIAFYCLTLSTFSQENEKNISRPIIEQKNGVEYVYNPAEPLYPKRIVTFEEELNITGEDEETGDIYLFKPGSFVVDGIGNIFIEDESDNAVKVFDENGKYVRQIGREGQGPGEFKSIFELGILPDNSLIVYDPNNRWRISLFNTDGAFIKSSNFDVKGFYRFSSILNTTNNSFTMQKYKLAKNRALNLWVITFDLDGRETINFGEFTPYVGFVYDTGDSWGSMSVPYTRCSIFAGDHDRKILYHCLNGEYKIEVYNDRGKLIRIIQRPYELIPVPSKEKEEYFERFRKRHARFVDQVKFPETKAAINNLYIDSEGNLWVETNEEKEENEIKYTAYDIFDSRGFYITKIWLDLLMFPSWTVFKSGKLYLKQYDRETGLISIKRYNIKWN